MVNRTFNIIESVPKRIIKFLGWLAILCLIIYALITIWGNVAETSGTIRMPNTEKATYSLLVRNTGLVLLTDDYEINGTRYTLNGYWEKIKNKFVYRDAEKTLDSKLFGPIEIKVRVTE